MIGRGTAETGQAATPPQTATPLQAAPPQTAK